MHIVSTSTFTVQFISIIALLESTVAKSQTKVKQYDSICYSNALKSKIFSLNQQFLFCSDTIYM